MKIYGELMNRIAEQSAQPAPVVGMGATITAYSDRYAGTVTYVSASGKKLEVTIDHAVRIDGGGMTDTQTYNYSPDPNGRVVRFYLDRYKCWRESKGTNGLILGIRDKRYDFSF